MKTSMRTVRIILGSLLAGALVACGSEATRDGAGSVGVLLEPEATILDGLQAGEDVEQIRDGWNVSFDKFILGVGNVHTHLGSDHEVEAEADEAFVIDLTQLPANGETLWEIDGLTPGRWTFGYEFVGGAHGGKRHETVSKTDFERIKNENLTYLIAGKLTKEGGVSCPPSALVTEPKTDPVSTNDAGDNCYSNASIQFEFAVPAETSISNCEQDGLPGFVIADQRQSTVAITIHGDHLFFNGFPEGSEGGIVRLGQIWADTDLDLDGVISTAEHQDILLADLAEWNDRYQKGGAPLERLETVGDLALGQLKTQGHMDGEGECASIDGVEHEHEN